MIHVTCRLTAKNRDQLRDPTLGNRLCMGYVNLSTHQTHNCSEYSIYPQYYVCCRVCSVRRAGGTRRLGASVRTCVATATRCASTTPPSATRRTWCRRRARCRRGRPADTRRSASRRHSAATTVGRSACLSVGRSLASPPPTRGGSRPKYWVMGWPIPFSPFPSFFPSSPALLLEVKR